MAQWKGLISRSLFLGLIAVTAWFGLGGEIRAQEEAGAVPPPAELSEGVEAPPSLDPTTAEPAEESTSSTAPVTSDVQTSADTGNASTATADGLAAFSPTVLAFGALVGLLLIVWLIVGIAQSAGVNRAWVVLGLPVLLVGALGVAYGLNQVKPSADVIAQNCVDDPPTATTDPVYFLMQQRGADNTKRSTFVQKLATQELIDTARAQIGVTNGATVKRPSGNLVKQSNSLNPTWSWSWEDSSIKFLTQLERDQQKTCTTRSLHTTELTLASVTDTVFCPDNVEVMSEIGTSLPVATFEVTVQQGAWVYSGVPGLAMKLDQSGVAALQSGNLLAFKYNVNKGAYDAITDTAYEYSAGTGYIFTSKSGNYTLKFVGSESYADTLHLKRGWNLVAIPSATKQTISGAYDETGIRMTPQEAVSKKIVQDSPYAAYIYDYTPGGTGWKLYNARFPEIGGAKFPNNRAFWVYAAKDLVVEFQ